MINYTIKRSNGEIFASIPNNVILGPNQPDANPVPINLVGRNKVSYGQATNENFLWLSENFAGEKAPRGAVKGQLWYNNYGTSAGQLLIALKDSARQPNPDDPTTELEWASVPSITLFNTLPDSDTSIMGRMVLTNNGESLMVVMKDKEWREIQTTRPLNKEYDSLLDINYDLNKKYIQFDRATPSKDICFFNNGGSFSVDANGFGYFVNGQGALHFGSNYFYELKILAREITENGDEIVPSSMIYKSWVIRGTFYTPNDSSNISSDGSYVPAKNMSDPREISEITKITDVITQSSAADNWNIDLEINPIDSTLPQQNSTSKDGYFEYITASLNSKKHLGFKIRCSMTGLEAGEIHKLQFSVHLRMSGIPPVGV